VTYTTLVELPRWGQPSDNRLGHLLLGASRSSLRARSACLPCRPRPGRARLNDRCSRTAGSAGHRPDPHYDSVRTQATDRHPPGARSV